MSGGTGAAGPGPWPVEIRVVRAERRLEIDWEDGTRASLPAELLRVESPSAEVQGHTPAQKVTVPGKRGVAIADVRHVGNYAVRIAFDDGHDTGLFAWPWLHRLGREREAVWADYLERLRARGLSRDP